MRKRFGVLAVLAGCQASTTRPFFQPLPAAAITEVRLGVREATQVLAAAFVSDSVPVARVEERDGYLETGWLDAKTLQLSHSQPLGQDIVRIRAWIGPTKPGSSEYQIETVYRLILDPSRPERELESEVPPDHPVSMLVAGVIRRLTERFGDPTTLPPVTPPVPAGAKGGAADSAAKGAASVADSVKAPAAQTDSTARPPSVKLDSGGKPLPAKKDSVAKRPPVKPDSIAKPPAAKRDTTP